MSIKNVGKGLRHGGIICALALGALCLAGCRTPSPEQNFSDPSPGGTTNSASTSTTNINSLEKEVLRVGDTLTVTFTDTPVPIPVFEEKIKEDGTITLLLNQTFTAAGVTPGELAKEIRKRYVPDYYKYMTVTVKQDVNTRWYYVDGEVNSHGTRLIYNSRVTVTGAIAAAGGFNDFANKKKVQLTRVDGRTQIVNCIKARSDSRLDPEVYPGDKIHVPRKLW